MQPNPEARAMHVAATDFDKRDCLRVAALSHRPLFIALDVERHIQCV